jgi:hypothetical protein
MTDSYTRVTDIQMGETIAETGVFTATPVGGVVRRYVLLPTLSLSRSSKRLRNGHTRIRHTNRWRKHVRYAPNRPELWR